MISKIISIAWIANGSENGECNPATYASIAWVKASIPVCAVNVCGIVSASDGSTIATSGVISKSASGYLIPVL